MKLFHSVEIQYFSGTKILREINVGNLLRDSNSAILAHLEALNINSYEFLHFRRLTFTKLTKFRAPKMAKKAVLELRPHVGNAKLYLPSLAKSRISKSTVYILLTVKTHHAV